jgi:hypothetical protein
MSVPLYDIFSVYPNKDTIWVEAVDNLAAANRCMAEHARENPGPYFIFCQRSCEVVGAVDTSMADAAKA